MSNSLRPRSLWLLSIIFALLISNSAEAGSLRGIFARIRAIRRPNAPANIIEDSEPVIPVRKSVGPRRYRTGDIYIATTPENYDIFLTPPQGATRGLYIHGAPAGMGAMGFRESSTSIDSSVVFGIEKSSPFYRGPAGLRLRQIANELNPYKSIEVSFTEVNLMRFNQLKELASRKGNLSIEDYASVPGFRAMQQSGRRIEIVDLKDGYFISPPRLQSRPGSQIPSIAEYLATDPTFDFNMPVPENFVINHDEFIFKTTVFAR